MTFVTKSVCIALFAAALVPAGAYAQEGRVTLSFTPAVATSSGDSELAMAGTIGYRVTEHFSFEGDVTWIDAAAGGFRNREFRMDGGVTASALNGMLQNLGMMFGVGGRNQMPVFTTGRNNTFNFPMNVNLPTVGNYSASTNGTTWIGTMGARYEPTVQTARFRPYVSGGIGINHTDEKFRVAQTAMTSAIDQSVSHSGMAFSAGGGATIKLVNALWVGADAKYFMLSRDRNLMRFGGGVTLKF